MSRESLSVKEAMQRAGVSRRTIYNWLSAGKLEYQRTAGGSVRIYTDTLFIKAQPGEFAVPQGGKA